MLTSALMHRNKPQASQGWGHLPLVLEWWLMSAEGDLMEAYWLER